MREAAAAAVATDGQVVSVNDGCLNVAPATASTVAPVAVEAIRSVPLPPEFVAARLPVPAVPEAPVAGMGRGANVAGIGAIAVGAAVAVCVATEPARDRRREAEEPLMFRQLIAPGLLRG